MSVERIPLPKDERINGYQVVKKSFDEKGQIFILRLKNQELVVTLTKDLIKSLHDKKDCTYGFVDLENEMVNGCRVVNKSYVENGVLFSTLTAKLKPAWPATTQSDSLALSRPRALRQACASPAEVNVSV